MASLDYERPTDLAGALALLARHGGRAKVLAGGTDVLVDLRRGKLSTSVLVDLKRVPGLESAIDQRASYLRVGALTTLADLVEHPVVRDRYPALVDAAITVGSPQIRHRATLVGNICNASPAADTAPALLIYGAVVTIVNASGSRTVPLQDFILGSRKTALGTSDLVVSVELPVSQRPLGAAFARQTRRRGVDVATVSVCCSVDSDRVVRFAFGAAAPRPFVVTDTSGVLVDPSAPEGVRAEALARITSQASPISDLRAGRDYRQAMLLVHSRRALRAARAQLAELLLSGSGQ